MKCPIETQETADLLLAYCTRRLDAVTRVIVERHVEGCAACQAFRETQQAVWDALDAWEAEPVSPDFNRRLYQRIEQIARERWWERLKQPKWTIPASVAAGLMLTAGILFEQAHLGAPPAPRTDMVQAEQVERTLEDMELLDQFPLVARSDSI
jgi:anti-sigma factor RsiW